MTSYIPVPIQVGDRQVLMGVGVFSWQVPPELNAAYVEIERRRREQEEQERQEGQPEADSVAAPATQEEVER